MNVACSLNTHTNYITSLRQEMALTLISSGTVAYFRMMSSKLVESSELSWVAGRQQKYWTKVSVAYRRDMVLALEK